jgi:uncharacterized protein (TIGR03437 family)
MMRQKVPVCLLAVLATGELAAQSGLPAAGFGQVVAIGGQASDLVLDEPRGLLYVANFTAARLEMIALADNSLYNSYRLPPYPAALALSPDRRFLLITHFGNFSPPDAGFNSLTVIDWESHSQTTLALPGPPLGVAFGFDGLALVVTPSQFLFYNPYSGRTGLIQTLTDVTANSLPAIPGTPPAQILSAQLAASADGRYIFGLTDSMHFIYEAGSKRIRVVRYASTPPLGPMVVSAARDGGYFAAGWAVFDHNGVLRSQFPNPAGQLAVGSHAIDSAAGLIYAQIPEAAAADGPPTPPVLTVTDADNLTVRERLRLPENLTGRSVLTAAGDRLYSISESGILAMPVSALGRTPRVAADREDLFFRAGMCQRGPLTRDFAVVDPGGGSTSFHLSTAMPGIRMEPAEGRTPTVVRVTLDPLMFQNRSGTVWGWITIESAEAVNVPLPVRVLVNTGAPGARGTTANVPGKLVDVLADPQRDRFYLLRQDRNQMLVYSRDGSEIAALRTFTTPSSVTLTADRKRLIIGHENSQLIAVYDADSLQQLTPVPAPPGHYPRSVAASSNAVLVASRVAGGPGAVDRIDLVSGTATKLPSLGAYQNSFPAETVAAGAPNGRAILIASADGNVLLYDATADTFTISRKLAAPLAGAYAVSSDGVSAIGNQLLNAALVPVATTPATDFIFGFAFGDGYGLRVSGPRLGDGATGILERIDTANGYSVRPVRMNEQPPGIQVPVFSRTLAAMPGGAGLITLTASGFTILAWDYDAGLSAPQVDRVLNVADLSPGLAPGTLVSIFGQDMGDGAQSCVVASGLPVPVLAWSPVLIQAQLPFEADGALSLTLVTPGGGSNDFPLLLRPAAPAVFRNGVAGPLVGLAAIVRSDNGQLVTPSNPIHPGDEIAIYLSGLGTTMPVVAAGTEAPADPLSRTVRTPVVMLGSVALPVEYSGLAPGQVGVYQVNARIPGSVPLGMSIPLSITQSGVSTSVDVRVVE